MPHDPNCIFCLIVAGKADANKVYEDEHTLVFMDIFPVSDGHTLLIPKSHCKDLFDADPEALSSLMATSKRVATALREAVRPEGMMVFQLNGAAAGQTVFHYHMHLLPRWADQPLELHTRKPGDPARLAELATKIAAVLD
ncbi:MAG: HIT family protein [Candidatus Binatia bacterium]|nr:HIT family protein [Candidatus Binatia bacterium]